MNTIRLINKIANRVLHREMQFPDDMPLGYLLEAMAFEKPIVAFDLNGMHDTLSPQSAILVNIDGKTPLEAKEAFSDGMKKLMLLTKAEKNKMGLAAHERLETVHSAAGVRKYIEAVVDGVV